MNSSNSLCIVLVASRNPLNIGAAARAMDNFGVRELRVVNPHQLAFREAKSAVGAGALLKSAKEYRNVADAIQDCDLVVGTTAGRGRELHHPLRQLPIGARLIRRRMHSGRVALLFGSEKRGLSNEDLSHCHWLIRIPTREQQPSMNLGQAVAICVYELARTARPEAKTEKIRLATAAELERMTAVLLDSLRASGYLRTNTNASTEEKIRRLVRRLKLSPEDAETWLGMIRQMLWKMLSGTKA